MRKKIVWLVVSCLMVAALVLASCGPAVTEEEEVVVEEEEEEVEEEEEEEVVEEKLLAPEVPKYGGTLTLCVMSDGGFIDPVFGRRTPDGDPGNHCRTA